MTITLRPYQIEPARAIVQDARSGGGHTFTVMMSRQAGKNELSAWIEKVLLTAAIEEGGEGVKCAPTFKPQLLTSMARLRRHLKDAGYGNAITSIEGFKLGVGNASWTFLSASPDSNVVSATAGLLLEADEAQDIEADKFTKEFRPMAASTNATTVLYGTAWSDATLLAQTIAENLELERKDSFRRHFQYDWRTVAAAVPAYSRFVQSERDRLGATHPLFTTQYDLIPLPGRGRLLSPLQLTNLQGQHPPEKTPTAGALYVAGLDVAGEDPDPLSGRDRDFTILSIGRVTQSPTAEKHLLPFTRLVALYAWQGTGHDALYAEIAHLLDAVWDIRHVTIDSTAIGEAAAILMSRSLGEDRVTAYRFTQQSKSHLGYQLQAAANTGRLQMWQPDGTPEIGEALRQLTLCKADYRPNKTVAWQVDPGDGHDDYATAIALLIEASVALEPPLIAHGTIPTR